MDYIMYLLDFEGLNSHEDFYHNNSKYSFLQMELMEFV